MSPEQKNQPKPTVEEILRGLAVSGELFSPKNIATAYGYSPRYIYEAVKRLQLQGDAFTEGFDPEINEFIYRLSPDTFFPGDKPPTPRPPIPGTNPITVYIESPSLEEFSLSH